MHNGGLWTLGFCDDTVTVIRFYFVNIVAQAVHLQAESYVWKVMYGKLIYYILGKHHSSLNELYT